MKYIAILILFFTAASLRAQSYAEQVKALQSADNWPAIEQVLKTQRDDLMNANQAAILEAVDVFRSERDAAAAARDTANAAAKDAAATAAAESAKAAVETAKRQAVVDRLKAAQGDGAKIAAVLADAAKSDADKQKAELDAKIAELQVERAKLNVK